ncbi:hypothetical protein EGR_09585 [Echinococcus granulosus]|uniref:Uncharacterized protein n=1 Tax=Echinococcus granulosus TaxID=6210 RepID=W6U368_ECHGR|nr:hypothetical protein EGR_09585 [Echinococcus granulosus]EUB55548.1 hypothetical protein EGR_09585 [Echinococcus granulosus]
MNRNAVKFLVRFHPIFTFFKVAELLSLTSCPNFLSPDDTSSAKTWLMIYYSKTKQCDYPVTANISQLNLSRTRFGVISYRHLIKNNCHAFVTLASNQQIRKSHVVVSMKNKRYQDKKKYMSIHEEKGILKPMALFSPF